MWEQSENVDVKVNGIFRKNRNIKYLFRCDDFLIIMTIIISISIFFTTFF